MPKFPGGLPSRRRLETSLNESAANGPGRSAEVVRSAPVMAGEAQEVA